MTKDGWTHGIRNNYSKISACYVSRINKWSKCRYVERICSWSISYVFRTVNYWV